MIATFGGRTVVILPHLPQLLPETYHSFGQELFLWKAWCRLISPSGTIEICWVVSICGFSIWDNDQYWNIFGGDVLKPPSGYDSQTEGVSIVAVQTAAVFRWHENGPSQGLREQNQSDSSSSSPKTANYIGILARWISRGAIHGLYSCAGARVRMKQSHGEKHSHWASFGKWLMTGWLASIPGGSPGVVKHQAALSGLTLIWLVMVGGFMLWQSSIAVQYG